MTFDAARDPRRTIDAAEIEALLPWYAAGTLPRRDRERVDDALRRDPPLSRQVELVREERAEIICLNESLGAPSAHAMDRLMASMDSEALAARKPDLARAIARRFVAFIAGFSPRILAAAAAVAVLAIAIQGFMLVDLLIKPAATYQIASVATAPGGPGTFAIVRFARDASAAEITEFLKNHQATLVDGPKPGGLYRVRLAATTLAKDEFARIVSRMRQDRVVASADPTE